MGTSPGKDSISCPPWVKPPWCQSEVTPWWCQLFNSNLERGWRQSNCNFYPKPDSLWERLGHSSLRDHELASLSKTFWGLVLPLTHLPYGGYQPLSSILCPTVIWPAITTLTTFRGIWGRQNNSTPMANEDTFLPDLDWWQANFRLSHREDELSHEFSQLWNAWERAHIWNSLLWPCPLANPSTNQIVSMSNALC